jgi:hypothetical protein
MDIRILKLSITLAVVVAALECASVSALAADPYYAVGISTTRLYLMTTGVPGSAVPVYEFGGAASLSDVQVYGSTVFVSDKAAGSVHILRLHAVDTSPYAQFIKTVLLDNGSLHVEQPLSIDVSGNGQSVYAVGKTWLDGSDNRHSNFAYLTSASGNWTDAQMQIGSIANSPLGAPMVDVATSANGALIAHTHIPSGIGAGSTWVSSVSGTSAQDPRQVGDKSFSPQAIAVNGAYGYVVNAFADDTMTGGSLSVLQAATGERTGVSFVLPDSLMPQDIVAFTYGTKNYLGIVASGALSNIQQVWRIELDPAGLPDFGTVARYTFGAADQSSNHYLAVSDDGSQFWISNGAAQTVVTTATIVRSSFQSGCRPFESPTMLRRRWPNPIRPSRSTNAPTSSGPRCARRRLMSSTDSGMVRAPSPSAT